MSLRKNIIANVAGQAWVAFTKLAFVPFYIKLMGIESYGLIGIFTLLQAWFIVLDLGLSPTISREMARYNSGVLTSTSIRDVLRSIEIIVFIVATLIATGVFLVSDWLGNELVKTTELGTEEVVNAFSIMGAIAALRFFEGIYHSALIGLERQVLFNIINAIMHTIRSVGALLVLMWWEPTIQSFFIWQGISSIIQTILLGLLVYNILPKSERSGKLSLHSLGSIKIFAGSMLLITALSLSITQIDKIILSGILNLEQFGYYTLAATIASTLIMISTPIMQATHPRMIGLVSLGNNNRIISLYHESTQLVTILTASIASLIAFFPENILYLWTNDIIITENTAPILSIMIISGFFGVLNYIPQSTQLAHNWLLLPLINNSITLVVLICLVYFSMPNFGVIGVVWSVLLAMLISFLISTYVMHSKILKDERLEFYIKDTFLPIIGAILPIYLASNFRPEDYISSIELFTFLFIAVISSLLASVTFSKRIRSKLGLIYQKMFRIV